MLAAFALSFTAALPSCYNQKSRGRRFTTPVRTPRDGRKRLLPTDEKQGDLAIRPDGIAAVDALKRFKNYAVGGSRGCGFMVGRCGC